MSVFIPPEGAMQFELTLAKLPDGAPVQGETFWISGKLGSPATCDICGEPRLLVIFETLSAYSQSLHKSRVRNPNTPTVCKCHGRIIE